MQNSTLGKPAQYGRLELWENLCKVLIPELCFEGAMVKTYEGDYELEEAFPASKGAIEGQPDISYPAMPPSRLQRQRGIPRLRIHSSRQ
jgi:hypothetical protein